MSKERVAGTKGCETPRPGRSGCAADDHDERPCAALYAVAFKIGDTIYEGKPKQTHAALYTRLLRERIVPAKRLDAWTAYEQQHGFVTENGEFFNRAEALARFGVARSQDMTTRQ